ncbi:MAG: hypothetical protein SXV54_12395 [Chloroflexota bacterium]|nr:hypothetical protein [Chloroflexota bacterium]
MNGQRSSRMNLILNMLVEEIEERIWARRPSLRPVEPPAGEKVVSPVAPAAESLKPEVLTAPPEMEKKESQKLEPEPELEMEPPLPPVLSGTLHASRLMGRMAVGLLVAIVLINIPFNRHGTTLATALPDSAALVMRDGLVVKEENDEKIFVFQNDQFRWISSLDAFEHFGYTWGDVHIVEDGFLDRFEIGTSLHVLLKCHNSPHIYRLEGGEKRWIRDITTFEAEGHVWDDVRFVSCTYLRDLPDGETIPPDSGPPPQP